MRKLLIASALACVLSAWLGLAVAHAQDVTLTVCKRNNPPLSCYETIQAAIDAAPVTGGIIDLPPGIYTQSEIFVTKNVTIRGAGPQLTIVQPASVPWPTVCAGRVFSISGVNASIENLTIRNGCTTAETGKPDSGKGGGILSNGTLFLRNVVVRDNAAQSLATGPGGAGEAVVLGGGIYSVGYLCLIDSSVYRNVVNSLSGEGRGGGWYNLGAGCAQNSTIVSNEVIGPGAQSGGGIQNFGSLSLLYTTVANNYIEGARVAGAGVGNSGAVVTQNSLLTANDAPIDSDLWCIPGNTNVNALGVNLYNKAGCGLYRTFAPPVGGLITVTNGIPVYVPDSSNSAVDGADSCTRDVTNVDQLGTSRPQGARCDVGAMEISRSYLTMASKGGERPNLVVQSVSVNPPVPSASGQTSVSVVIANIGTITSTSSFWVDLYVNPKSTPPTYAGTPWSQLCTNQACNKNYGVAWRVTTQLGIGQSLTLQTVLPGQAGRPDIYIVPQYSKWPNRLPAGNYNVWAVVDSWGGSEDNIFGTVYEWNEFDNRGGPLGFYVAPAAVSSAAAAEEAGGEDQPIPPRVEPTNP